MNSTQKRHFRHRFSNPASYLHHRPPFLLVQQIDEIGERHISTRKTVRAEDGYVQGHFPGAPIFPGSMMQELTTQSAGILIAANFNPMEDYRTDDPNFNAMALGVLVRVKQARYLSFARPGDELKVIVTLEENLDDLFDFNARITCGDRILMKNSFQLANISSELLTRGERPK